MILRRSSKDLEKILTSFVIDSGADHIGSEQQQETITASCRGVSTSAVADAALDKYDAVDVVDAVDGDVVVVLKMVWL